MAWPSVPKGFLGARLYSAHFHYPLSTHEQWFWQVGTSFPKPKKNKKADRTRCEQISNQKLQYLKSNIWHLESNPFTLAIFITGSLAMSNCSENDDIDLMFISKPNSLWLCRLWNILVLKKYNLRRPPSLAEHNSIRVNNKLCDNLYLEDLNISEKNLYTAHEILQAKPVYDPFGIQRKFLEKNSWAGEYLPIAYRETLKISPKSKPTPKTHWLLPARRSLGVVGNIGHWILNIIAFLTQYIYMYPKITSEKVSLRQAFFHPRSSVL